MSSPPLLVGLIGFGFAGQTFHAPLIRATDGLRLACVGSRDAARVHAALGEDVVVVPSADLPATKEVDLDIVVIATPNDTHYPLALAALRAGRHVVVDKPFALDAEQCAALVAAGREAGRVLSVFHNRRWDSDFLTMASLVRDGRVGRPVELQSAFDRYRPVVRDRWREGSGPGAGLWFDLGPHLLDQAVALFGAPSGITVDCATLRDAGKSCDWFTAVLRYADDEDSGAATEAGGSAKVRCPGLRVQLRASVLAAEAAPRYVLHGTGGSWSVGGVDAQEDALKAGPTPEAVAADTWGADARPSTLTLRAEGKEGDAGKTAAPVAVPLLNGAYPSYYAGMRDAVRGAGPNPVPAEEALTVQLLLDAGIVSARERREVPMAEVIAAPGGAGAASASASGAGGTSGAGSKEA